MPRVHQKKKSRAGKQYTCEVCRNEIAPGETYYEWSFRYGGAHRQHTAHGMPRQSQLTQSKMGAVYQAVEALEDWEPLAAVNFDEDTTYQDVCDEVESIINDAENAISQARDEAQGVMDEYEEAIEAMPASEEQNQERIDVIEEWINELDDKEGDLGSITPDDVDQADLESEYERCVDEIKTLMGDAASAFTG